MSKKAHARCVVQQILTCGKPSLPQQRSPVDGGTWQFYEHREIQQAAFNYISNSRPLNEGVMAYINQRPIGHQLAVDGALTIGK